MIDVSSKYDRLAQKFAEVSYANLEFDMYHRLNVAITWGTPLQPGDSVLELGCGDGHLAALFVRYGLQYCGVDISGKMIDVANRRLQKAGLEGRFLLNDVAQLTVSDQYDAVIAYMRTFFAYVRDPLMVLQRLRPLVRKKIILDLNPRSMTLGDGISVMRFAGFTKVTWRPFFVPKEKKLSSWLLKTLVLSETVPFVRAAPLRWKFNCLLKGEV
jgi:ubiquinone/menaquinone biosynthesis C-methylase UbiE